MLEQLRPQLEADLGVQLQLNLAGSGTLTRQIMDGAPADAVILAHPAWMDTLVEAARVAPTDHTDLVSNRLAVVGRDGAIALEDLADATRFHRIAVGDPASVPAGRYAEQALRDAGVWDAVRPRLVTTADVRAALAYVVAGEVDAAIVYASDIVGLDASRDTLSFDAVDPTTHDPILITVGVVDNSEAGRRLADWLQGDTAVCVFADAGFIPRRDRQD